MFKYPVIIFEGIEASGKSTNIQIVSDYLKKLKKKFIKIREPGGSKYSEIIRNLILNKESKLNYKTDLFLILASRSENINKIIKKNFRKKIIIIDRFTDSTIAYQHYGMGINLNIIKQMNNFVIDKFKADLTILSIVNNKNMRKRLNLRKKINKYDKFNYSFYDKVQKGFLKIARNNKNYIIIDSNKKSIKENSNIIIENIKKKISI
jgi:dTMP kinase